MASRIMPLLNPSINLEISIAGAVGLIGETFINRSVDSYHRQICGQSLMRLKALSLLTVSHMLSAAYIKSPIKLLLASTGATYLIYRMFYTLQKPWAPRSVKYVVPVLDATCKIINSLAVGLYAKSLFKEARHSYLAGATATVGMLSMIVYNFYWDYKEPIY